MKDLSLHILDIVHNSIRAEASLIKISIFENQHTDSYKIRIQDNGKGISPQLLPTVSDPFTTRRKTRRVGMGLALLRQNAEQAAGSLTILSEIGKGTTVNASFEYHNIDRPPIGDIAGVIVQLVIAFPKTDFVYSHKSGREQYVFDTRQIKQELGDMPIVQPEIRSFLLEMINENLNKIRIAR